MSGGFVLTDLDTFFNPDELGDTALHHGETFYGQFNEPYRAINSQLGVIEVTDPTFLCKTSDVTTLEIVNGNTLTIGGNDYLVIGREPGDPGITTLVLRPA